MKNMTSYKICYIVLNYRTYEETTEFVKSTSKLLKGDDQIIIVDNASEDGSGKKIADDYKESSNVRVILSDRNLGFAGGNNLGFVEAKKLEYDFIIFSNSDILICGSDFRSRLIDSYEKNKFDIEGPLIRDAKGNISLTSPQVPTYLSYERALKGKRRNEMRYYLSFLGIDKLVDRCFSLVKYPTDYNLSVKEDVQLAGCFLIFSKGYIERFDGIDDRTFLFLEEPLLYLRAKKNGLKIMFDPTLEVIHYEDASVGKVCNRKSGKMRRFQYIHQRKSFEILCEELMETDNT